MKFKLTPLFIFSVALIILGLYLYFFFEPGEEGWGRFLAVLICASGALGLMVYLTLRVALKNRVWTQLTIEVALVGGIIFYIYKKTGHYEFILPHNYKGYVILIYGVDQSPKLNTSFYSNKAKFKVPPSGLILTSSVPKNDYSNPAIFLDSDLGEIRKLPVPLRRYDIPYRTDTLKCDSKTYLMDIWFIKDEPNWSRIEDSLSRLDLKLIEACTLSKQ